jgi:predicted PurR-regulated permease PerM
MTFETQVVRATGIAIGLILLTLVLWQLGFVFLLVFAAILVAIFLRALAMLISDRTPLGPGASLATVLCVLVLVTAGFGMYLTPRLTEQASQMKDTLPNAWSRVEDYVRTLPFGDQIVNQAGGENGVLTGEAVQSKLPRLFSVTFTGVVQFAFVLITGIYLAARPQPYIQGILKLLPGKHRGRACEFLSATGYTLQWWLIGQAIIMILVGAATATGLALLGVPLALMLGVIAGLLDFVPNIGPIIAAVPGVLVALLSGPETALYAALLYFAIQQLEGYVLTPLVHKQTVSLEPALIITAQLGFGLTVGALGVLLATPLVAVALVAIKMLYVEDVLGHRTDVGGTSRAGEVCAVDE